MKTFNSIREETLEEKLKASDPTGKWIHDFVHSDDPKFAGKSKKERIRMALGASYGAKKVNEKFWDNEGEMIHSQLTAIIDKAQKIRDTLNDTDSFEAWVQSEVTTASDAVTCVFDYLMYGKDVKEAVNPAQQAAIAINMKKRHQKPKNESIEESVKTTHEDPLVTVHHTNGELWTHANLSVANAIHKTKVSHHAVHAGPTKSGDWTYNISKHHVSAMKGGR